MVGFSDLVVLPTAAGYKSGEGVSFVRGCGGGVAHISIYRLGSCFCQELFREVALESGKDSLAIAVVDCDPAICPIRVVGVVVFLPSLVLGFFESLADGSAEGGRLHALAVADDVPFHFAFIAHGPNVAEQEKMSKIFLN